MLLSINGKKEDIDVATLQELVQHLGLKKESLVIEHNCSIIKQDQWTSTALSENDQIELLSFVGGG